MPQSLFTRLVGLLISGKIMRVLISFMFFLEVGPVRGRDSLQARLWRVYLVRGPPCLLLCFLVLRGEQFHSITYMLLLLGCPVSLQTPQQWTELKGSKPPDIMNQIHHFFLMPQVVYLKHLSQHTDFLAQYDLLSEWVYAWKQFCGNFATRQPLWWLHRHSMENSKHFLIILGTLKNGTQVTVVRGARL